MRGEGGGHASESEQSAPNRKEPGNPPDHHRIIPKGAIIHTINHPDEQRPLRAETAPERQRKETAPPKTPPQRGSARYMAGHPQCSEGILSFSNSRGTE